MHAILLRQFIQPTRGRNLGPADNDRSYLTPSAEFLQNPFNVFSNAAHRNRLI